MTSLLEVRDIVKKFYARYAVFLLPIVKFVVAFLMICTINSKLGYMDRLDNLAIVLILSLTTSILPSGVMVFIGALLCMLHLYALSLETAIVGLCFFLILFLLFFRFAPKYSLVVVLTPLMFVMKIPYVLPVVLGLVATPVAAISAACGIAVYYFLAMIIGNAPTLLTMGDTEMSAKIRLLLDGILANKSMLVIVMAFAITVVVVYMIRRLPMDYNWTIAMVAGAIVNLVILLVGDLIYDTSNFSALQAILGALLAVAVGKVVEFFRFCVDFGRAENVQFEDDEYYYYVKAVPKMVMAAPAKTVKRINAQTSSARSVTTERTARGTDKSETGSEVRRPRPDKNAGARSVTINSIEDSEDTDDFEELF